MEKNEQPRSADPGDTASNKKNAIAYRYRGVRMEAKGYKEQKENVALPNIKNQHAIPPSARHRSPNYL